MVIKRLILAFVFFCSTSFLSAITLDTSPYQSEANNWIHTYVVSPNKKIVMSNQDLQLVANLLYFSFLRSAVTLEAQDIACSTLEIAWQGWQNIAQTRRNPSLQTPYQTDYGMQSNLFQDFLQAQYFHRKIGLTYAECAEVAVKGKMLTNNAQEAVTALREQARIIVAHAFLDVKKILGELYNFAAEHTRAKSELDELIEYQSRFDLMETISTYIPSLAMKSFVEADHINTKASEQSWQVVSTINKVSKEIWQAIEVARASYYLAHYNALMPVLKEYAIDINSQQIMFDENGILPEIEQYQILPEVIQEN